MTGLGHNSKDKNCLSLKRHPDYYYEDGTIVVQTEDGVLFRLYAKLLAQHSEVWADMLSLPRPVQQTNVDGPSSRTRGQAAQRSKTPLAIAAEGRNGESDETAVMLSYSAEVFADFISVFINTPSTVPGSTRGTSALINILRMSHFLIAPYARSYAIRALQDRPDFSPARKLYCARAYNIQEWIESSVEAIIRQPLTNSSEEERACLGQATLDLVCTTKEAISLHRTACAVHPPPVVHMEDCTLERWCEDAWRKTWWGEHNKEGVVHSLLLSDVPLRAVLEGLSSTVPLYMETSCHAATIAKLEQPITDGGKFLLDEKLIHDAVVTLVHL